tara:strand:- start:27443 stop:27610 length:168 start_codon:yes stop_codon:yes gene_type:complete
MNKFFRSVLILKCVIAIAGLGLVVASNSGAPEQIVLIAQQGVVTFFLPEIASYWL